MFKKNSFIKEEETKTDPLTNWCYCVSYHRKSGKRGKKEHEPDELTYVQYILPKGWIKFFI